MAIFLYCLLIAGVLGAWGFRVRRERSIKLLTCMIRPDGLQNVVAALRREDLMLGMTAFDVRGFGRQRGDTKKEGKDGVRFLPKLKLEILVMEKNAERAMKAIGDSLRTGQIGDGKIVTFRVASVMRVRTGERGPSALK